MTTRLGEIDWVPLAQTIVSTAGSVATTVSEGDTAKAISKGNVDIERIRAGTQKSEGAGSEYLKYAPYAAAGLGLLVVIAILMRK